MSTEVLTPAQFAESLNSTFRLRLDGTAAVEVTLVEVSEPKISRRQERFDLIFRGPVEVFLPQQTYIAEHAALGTFDLFIVPVGQEESGFLYQSVFNRVLDPDKTA
jgi:hypothetical protein